MSQALHHLVKPIYTTTYPSFGIAPLKASHVLFLTMTLIIKLIIMHTVLLAYSPIGRVVNGTVIN